MAGRTRKCEYCKDTINVGNKDNLGHVLLYKKKYYHKECFVELAESRVAAQNRYSASWQLALDNIDQLVEDARLLITVKVKTDVLDEYLRLHYNINEANGFKTSFWATIADIGNGVYRHRRCAKIDCDTLVDMWKWGQNKLDKINVQNKSRGVVMEGEERVIYDLAILMNKYGFYLKHKAKEAVAIAEATREINAPKDKIDYNIMSKNAKSDTKDIASIIDDIF